MSEFQLQTFFGPSPPNVGKDLFAVPMKGINIQGAVWNGKELSVTTTKTPQYVDAGKCWIMWTLDVSKSYMMFVNILFDNI